MADEAFGPGIRAMDRFTAPASKLEFTAYGTHVEIREPGDDTYALKLPWQDVLATASWLVFIADQMIQHPSAIATTGASLEEIEQVLSKPGRIQPLARRDIDGVG